MKMADLIEQIQKCEAAITVADRNFWSDINNSLFDARRALNMAASYFTPISNDEARFLHGLIDELTIFVSEGPEYDGDTRMATDAIRRMNSNIRDFNCGDRAASGLGNLFCLAY